MNTAGLYQLMTWFSSFYPIGSFHYSHGIEYAIESNLITEAKSLREWISGILSFGSARTDTILFKITYELFKQPSASLEAEVAQIIRLCNALKATPELWRESSNQGQAAMNILTSTYHSKNLHLLACQLKQLNKEPVPAIVFAGICAEYAIQLEWALTAYLHGFVTNLITAGIKLIPLGQTEGQVILADLEADINARVTEALNSEVGDIGSACPMVDWTSVEHETQYTRLFQS